MTAQSYPILMSHLNDKRAMSFAKLVEEVAATEVEGLLTASEHSWMRGVFNNCIEDAWKAAIREPFTHDGRFMRLSEAEKALSDKLYWPQSHIVAGYLKRASAAKKAAGPMRDAMLALLEEVVPLALRIVALKTKIGKRPPTPTKTSIAREERAALAMTCQCCDRDILAETGEIAHHGYERPGGGWQTASCYGALALPFEVSRERLGELIIGLRQQLEQMQTQLVEVKAEAKPLTWTYYDRTKPTNQFSGFMGGNATVDVTRETFQQAYDDTLEVRKRGAINSYDDLKVAKMTTLASEIKYRTAELTRQQARYNTWKQTHERRDGAWAKL